MGLFYIFFLEGNLRLFGVCMLLLLNDDWFSVECCVFLTLGVKVSVFCYNMSEL